MTKGRPRLNKLSGSSDPRENFWLRVRTIQPQADKQVVKRASRKATGYSPQNRTADAGDARRVRRRCTPARFLAARPAHLPQVARGRERDSLENRLLILRDIRNGGNRAVGTCGGRRRPGGRRTRRLVARQGRRGAHGAVTSVSAAWKSEGIGSLSFNFVNQLHNSPGTCC